MEIWGDNLNSSFCVILTCIDKVLYSSGITSITMLEFCTSIMHWWPNAYLHLKTMSLYVKNSLTLKPKYLHKVVNIRQTMSIWRWTPINKGGTLYITYWNGKPGCYTLIIWFFNFSNSIYNLWEACDAVFITVESIQ